MEDSKIAWTHHTHNVVWGCTPVSPGCMHCYAAGEARRWGKDCFGPGKDRWIKSVAYWRNPIRWNRDAEAAGERRRVFCGSMCDICEDHPTVAREREKLWSLIKSTPCLDWLLLTKRPERYIACLPSDWGQGYANVFLGVTAEDQPHADLRLPLLSRVPARVRFVSYEPALEAVDFRLKEHRVDWLIVGGESGNQARRFDLAWAEYALSQCRAAGVAFFMKQYGSRPEACGSRIPLQDCHGRKPEEWPEKWRIQEFPHTAAVDVAAGPLPDRVSEPVSIPIPNVEEPSQVALLEAQLTTALEIVRKLRADRQ